MKVIRPGTMEISAEELIRRRLLVIEEIEYFKRKLSSAQSRLEVLDVLVTDSEV